MFSEQMRQNNNQQQNSFDNNVSPLAPIHESTVTKKVLQLEYEIQKTQKCYHVVKKPIKYFSKIKRSLAEPKNSQYDLQVGVLSQKIIPPNIGQNLSFAEKPTPLQNPKLKNVFEAYKQTLQQKYRKKRRLMQKAALKINISKNYDNQTASQLIINEKQQFIKKRISNKRLDPNLISSHQPSPMYRQNLLKSVRQKQPSSRQFQTIDDNDTSNHNFVRSINKKPLVSIFIPHDHYLSNKQVSIYQVKKKCYSEERENRPVRPDELNKTKNISFRLPNEKRKSTKHFIQKLGGLIYNLPQISDKVNDKSDTISYLVKSLRKPSASQHFKASVNNPQINLMPKFQQHFLNSPSKQRPRRIRTLQMEYDTSIFTQHSIQNFIDAPQDSKNYDYLKANKISSQYQIKHQKAKKKLVKYNFVGDIDGWNTENQLPEFQNHLMHHFVSLQPTELQYEE